MATAPRLLLVTLLLFAASPAPSVADRFVVGGKQHWARGVDYTTWPDKYHFHVGDWLLFNYEKDMYDVMQVSETAYAACDASNPIVSYSRGRSFVFQLNNTGRYYFICSRGYCWSGMKVSVLVEPQPPSVAPSTSASPHASSARSASGVWCYWWALTASLGAAAVLGLPFAV